MPIKTLHITNCYHPSSGGIRTFYRALLNAANQRHRKIRLVVPGAKNSVEDVGEFARIYTIAAPASPFVDSTYRLLLPHLYALPYRSKLRRIIEEEQPGIWPTEPPADGGVGMMTSFGLGITLTPLELSDLVSAIANGGTLYHLQHPKSQDEIAQFESEFK